MSADHLYLQDTRIQFGSRAISFLKVKDVNNLPHDNCRLWALEWKSAFAFSEFLFTFPTLKYYRILEIGAGSGLVGVCCALQSADVTITDRVEAATTLITKNLELNQCADQAKVLALDWNKLEGFTEQFEFIVGSDVLYQSRNVEAILGFISTNCLCDGGLVMLFCPGRGYAQRFEELSTVLQNSSLKDSNIQLCDVFFLYQIKLPSCEMPELHIVALQKGSKLLAKNQEMLNKLREWVAHYQAN